MSREAIARTLKRLRIKSGLTANQVGEKLGKAEKRLIRGKITEDSLMPKR